MSEQSICIGIDATPLINKISGIGRYTYELTSSYATKNPNQKILLICFAGDIIHEAYQFTQNNIEVFRIPLPRKLYQFTYRKFFRISLDTLLRAKKIDALFCPNFTIFPYVKRIPSIIVVHDVAYIHFPDSIEKKNLKYLTKHIPLSTKDANTIITISEFTKSELIKQFNIHRDSIHVLPLGVSKNLGYLVNAPKEDFLLFVGTREPRKNLSRLITAHQSLDLTTRRKHPLKIVGSLGWNYNSALEDDKYIEFLGYVSDEKLHSMYTRSRLLIFPSLYEGFGLPLIEAMRNRVPILCSDIVPFKEITDNTAYYFTPNDTADIAYSLKKVLQKPVDIKKIEDAYKKSLDYTWDKSGKELTDIIKTVYLKSSE